MRGEDMFNTLGRPRKGAIFFDSDSKMIIDHIISGSIDIDSSPYKTEATVNLLPGQDIYGELFTLTVPDEKEETAAPIERLNFLGSDSKEPLYYVENTSSEKIITKTEKKEMKTFIY